MSKVSLKMPTGSHSMSVALAAFVGCHENLSRKMAKLFPNQRDNRFRRECPGRLEVAQTVRPKEVLHSQEGVSRVKLEKWFRDFREQSWNVPNSFA